jgi:branched-chain amino acid aminotransferase
VLAIARELGIPARERPVPRETLYNADELFFTGTASEVTPIRSVDRITIGAGRAGPITRALQQRFLDVVHGRASAPAGGEGWLAYTRRLAPAETAGAAR